MTKEERIQEMEEVWAMMGLTLTIFHEIEYHLSHLGLTKKPEDKIKQLRRLCQIEKKRHLEG